MFARLLLKLLRGSQGRLVVALVALISGAAVISALLNLDLDIQRKLANEFRTLGANVVIAPGQALQTKDAGAAAPSLMDEATVLNAIRGVNGSENAIASPYLYIVARSGGTPLVIAGTWLDLLPKLEPTWKVEGQWISSRDDALHCLVGRQVAREFHLLQGSELTVENAGREAKLAVAAIVDSGGAEDNQIFVNLAAVQNLAGLEGQIGLAQLSVSGAAGAISDFVARLARALPQFEVTPIRQVTEAEGELLGRIRLLVISMISLILALTAICVLATMAALAMERREDVGLMKALGGSISRVVGLFLAEVGVLGAAGGLIGCVAGVGLSYWMGKRVFGLAISARWEIFPLTVAVMTGVALAGALPLRLLGSVKPAVILRGE